MVQPKESFNCCVGGGLIQFTDQDFYIIYPFYFTFVSFPLLIWVLMLHVYDISATNWEYKKYLEVLCGKCE